ncbi:S-adenosylmethionine:tRNA ribosyltransferase-isomerase [Niallia taxi]|nr:S-adenosylmethionine:tRNA ribosyltransferase-isomerase [Niallia taxi]MDE5052239.1 S-adenosylmethionine:tRNA ribosyltransferase-isomerase [Niallia taxi]
MKYRTVYAKVRGSAAAPRAGQYFTDELAEELKTTGVHNVFIGLPVGLGTFRPVLMQDIDDDEVRAEFYLLRAGTAKIMNKMCEDAGRILSVGTTAPRTFRPLSKCV